MSHLIPSQVMLYDHIRNSILTHAALVNPSTNRRLELITCLDQCGDWEVRVVLLTPEPCECRILAHADSSVSEIAAMQDLLYDLQLDSGRMLRGRRVGEVFNIDEGAENVSGDMEMNGRGPVGKGRGPGVRLGCQRFTMAIAPELRDPRGEWVNGRHYDRDDDTEFISPRTRVDRRVDYDRRARHTNEEQHLTEASSVTNRAYYGYDWPSGPTLWPDLADATYEVNFWV
ncbi:hypothetical protein BDW02DRAFT_635262 [Decorospora gaudefroyi]|uniref:Uncharacterized protein n=1 Tax=Decorospora gaudefroyi TaxID=184978 RepID=A0A6A5K1J0_9PLEO|nr:hypothetical protein BDW02DRAFT_635262 [Decorospora gaudefroyi]